jgi:hypothetical protein
MDQASEKPHLLDVTETFALNLISALPALRLPHAQIRSSRLHDVTPSVVLYHHSDKHPTGEGSIPSGGKRDQNNYRDTENIQTVNSVKD